MKIAVATDDGRTVSHHFGRAAQFAVLTVEDGVVVAREIRAKHAPHGTGSHENEAGGHTGPAAQARHAAMLAPLADCSWVIAGGMGRGAYEHIMEAGLRAAVTNLRDVDEAALACAGGRLVDHAERLH